MENDLKPCPCCGSNNTAPTFAKSGTPAVAAECKNCGLQTKYYDNFILAKNVWNKRTKPDSKRMDPEA